MSDNKSDRGTDISLALDTASDITSKQAYDDPVSPKQRGRSPLESYPPHFRHYGPTSPMGSATGPGGNFGTLSPDAAGLVYPIRSVVNISEPPQSAPHSPNTFWSANSSVTGSTTGGTMDEIGVGLGIQSRSQSKSPRSSLGQDRRASIVSTKGIYGTVTPERGGGSSKAGSLSVSSIADSLSASGEREDVEAVSDDKAVMREGGDEGRGAGGTRLGGGNQPMEDVPEESYMTSRFKHIMTEDGHVVVTGVSGSESMQRCEDEPIHIPGAIQGFGLLLALKENEDGKLNVKIVSEVCSQLEQL